MEGGGGEKGALVPKPGAYRVNSPFLSRELSIELSKASSNFEIFQILGKFHRKWECATMPDSAPESKLPKDWIRENFGEKVIESEFEWAKGSYLITLTPLKEPQQYTKGLGTPQLVVIELDPELSFEENFIRIQKGLAPFDSLFNDILKELQGENNGVEGGEFSKEPGRKEFGEPVHKELELFKRKWPIPEMSSISEEHLSSGIKELLPDLLLKDQVQGYVVEERGRQQRSHYWVDYIVVRPPNFPQESKLKIYLTNKE